MMGLKRRKPLAMQLMAALAVTAIVGLFRPSPAEASNWLEMNFWLSGPRYDANVPACNNDWVLSTIRSRFATKESRFWMSDLSIKEMGDIKQVAFRPWSEETVPRRFCAGKVLVSDGRWRQVYYSIVEDGGIIGAKWGVEWCVVGLDRNWAYNPACKMARP
jgi:hypothetical protein